MAEFCLDCWNKLMDSNDPPEKYVIYTTGLAALELTQSK